MTDEEMRNHENAIGQISKVLAGKDPEIQGAILADLLAMWLAGFIGHGAKEAREALLEAHIETVRELVAVHDKQPLHS